MEASVNERLVDLLPFGIKNFATRSKRESDRESNREFNREYDVI